ncbi:MAG: hypothetical protein GEV10_08650 [Streptosporangiales bacterium]|nr:hypothetical protein [Streptosporangiales bacterium]
MAATTSMLDAAQVASMWVDFAATRVGDAAKKAESGRSSFGTVRDGIAAGVGWSGTGQPAASLIVTAATTSMDTAAIRLRDVQTHLGAFSGAMAQAVAWWQEMSATLDKKKYAVADDGTVTLVPGVELADGDPSPGQLTSEVKQILSYLDAADETLTARLKAAVTDPLPVVGTYATLTLSANATEAWLAAKGPNAGMGPYATNPWDKSWTPDGNVVSGTAGAWDLAVLLGAPCLPGGVAYTGGGFLVGPDGKEYPVVTPQYAGKGGELSGHGPGAETLGGLDTGWQTLATYTGYDQLGEPLSTAEAGMVIAGAIAGAQYQPYTTVNASATQSLVLDEYGYPVAVADTPPGSTAQPPGVPASTYTYVVTDGKGQPQVGSYTAPGMPGGNLVAVGTNVAEGLAAVDQADANSYYTYQVEFQQNTDGRVRAIYTAYQVIDGPDGQYVQPYDVHFDEDGQMVLEEAGWTAPPPISEGGSSVDVHGSD